jgi:hypothetical protein
MNVGIIRNNSVGNNATQYKYFKKLKLDDNHSKKNKDKNSGIRGRLNALSLSLYYDPQAIFRHNQDSIVCVVVKNTKKGNVPNAVQ